MNAALEISSLSMRRGTKRVLDGVSMKLRAGEVAALIGPNGAGKSSLVLALAGMLPIESGTITLDGRRVDGLEPHEIRRAGIAAVPEGHQVLTRLTVEENLAVAAAFHEAAQAGRLMEQAYELFPELGQIRRRLAGALSGGEAQMLALAQAMVAAPKFLLVDEMSLGLAPVIVQRLIVAIRGLVEQGIGILLIEQFTQMALRLADTVYVIDRGSISFNGSPADLNANPRLLQDTYLAAEIVAGRSSAREFRE